MSKTKLIATVIISAFLIIGIGTAAYLLSQPKKITQIETKSSTISSVKSDSTNPFKKSTFDNSKKNTQDSVITVEDSKPKKFTDSNGVPIKETDLNNYSQARDETLLYSDDFVSANCESYNLTINSSQNCYINFRKEILDSEVGKVKAVIVPAESGDENNQESSLSCKLLNREQNPNKNTLSCTTNNLGLRNSGNYNLTITVREDVLTNSLEKNIEALTVSDFQQKYSDQVEN
jgi:hypothetical protein